MIINEIAYLELIDGLSEILKNVPKTARNTDKIVMTELIMVETGDNFSFFPSCCLTGVLSIPL